MHLAEVSNCDKAGRGDTRVSVQNPKFVLRTQTPTQIIDNLILRFVVSFATAAFEIDILNCEASFLVEGPDFELKISIVD